MQNLHVYIALWLFTNVLCDNESTKKSNLSDEETPLKNLGKFWQITDIHWDMQYSETGDPDDMCHDSSDDDDGNSTGYFGNYFCDSPYALVKSAIHAMKLIEPNPNFILWTGDNAPHTDYSNFPVIYETLNNVTKEMRSLFGSDIPIIPVLGNHDTYPRDDYPPTGESFYSQYLNKGNWKGVIPADCHEDFNRGGYYKVEVNAQLDVLVLNTNLYYRHNEMGQGLKDPGDQFKWLKGHLQNAKDSNRKVLIAAHAPPGFWERKPEISFFNDTYNDEYVDTLNYFGDQIVAQIYGHEHTDSFKLFGTSPDDIKSVGFLAPSLTPWYPSRMEGGTAINPSLRLYTYSVSVITDYIQYHLNLTEANKSKLSDSCIREMEKGLECDELSKNLWKEYYNATSVFGVKSLDAKEMKEVFNNLCKNDTYFQGYYLRNSAGIDHGYCNDTCKLKHICAISHLKTPSILKCLNASYMFSDIFGMYDTRLIIFLCLVGVLAVILGIIIIIMAVPRRALPSSAEANVDWVKNKRRGYRPLSTVEGD